MALTPPPSRRTAPPRPLSATTAPATKPADTTASETAPAGAKTVATTTASATTAASAPKASTPEPKQPEANSESSPASKGVTTPRTTLPARSGPSLPPPRVTRPATPPAARTVAPRAATPRTVAPAPAAKPTTVLPRRNASTPAARVPSPPPARPLPRTTTRPLPPRGSAATPASTKPEPEQGAPQEAKAANIVKGERRSSFVQPQVPPAQEPHPRAQVYIVLTNGPDVVFGANGEVPRVEDQESALHTIRSCTIAVVRPDGAEERKEFSGESAERDGLTYLVSVLNEKDENALHPRLVTYLGRNKLMPRLYVAAMLYGIKLGVVGETSNRHASFQTRFNTYYHLDLADQINHYGASRAPALNTLAEAVGGEAGRSDLDNLIFIHKKMESVF